MTEVLLGKARPERFGDGLFLGFLQYDDRMAGRFIDLTWGEGDSATIEQDGHRFRVDRKSLSVYELFED